MQNIYEDDALVGRITTQLVESGSKVFQIFQHGTEQEHASYMLELMRPYQNANILDVGCGVGEVARLMQIERPDLNFTLLNPSQAQLDMCPPHFRKVKGKAESIPFPDNEFDVVMACYSLGHTELDESLPELRRVLRNGGLLFVMDMAGGAMADLSYMAHDWKGAYILADLQLAPSFLAIVPDFRERYPSIFPILFREIKCPKC